VTPSSIRRRTANDKPVRTERSFVLYWMTAARRASWNFSLDAAVEWARELEKPLLVLEALRCDYPWASDRHHAFVLDGMRDNADAFARHPVTYYPYVEPSPGAGKGLLAALSRHAAVVITDDYPAFVIPGQIAAAAHQIDVRVEQVDSNGLLPMYAASRAYPTAYAFRRFLQKTLAAHLPYQPARDPLRSARGPAPVIPPAISRRWKPGIPATLQHLPIDHSVGATGQRGGTRAARTQLKVFIESRLEHYGDRRVDAVDGSTSGLSPYLHFGHISAHEVFAAVMRHAGWLGDVPSRGSGAKAGWWGVNPAADAFLDELVTWRELGFNMCAYRPDYDRYESLPDWARATLDDHRRDPRPHRYSRTAFEAAATHDPLWNAAQRQLVRDGRIHSYLRMLWGKKVLEWSRSPREALEILIDLNNKYALDGRDPNSYSGIFWVFGRYDRPWPEREIFGQVRYMSSSNTARKLRVSAYVARYADAQGQRAKGKGQR
jgi:deoxyribodipyrimidine photo-lyase